MESHPTNGEFGQFDWDSIARKDGIPPPRFDALVWLEHVRRDVKATFTQQPYSRRVIEVVKSDGSKRLYWESRVGDVNRYTELTPEEAATLDSPETDCHRNAE